MPELPEVETIRRDLADRIVGARIEEVEVLDRRVIRGQTPDQFAAGLRGARIQAVERRGKALILVLEDRGFLVVQLMMTGQMIFRADSAPEKASKIIFTLSNQGRIYYNDQRLFGRLQAVRVLAEVGYFRDIGPEPLSLEFTPQALQERLAGRRTPIKPLLLDHRVVAGIGNIYASEILYASRIDPRRAALTLVPRDVRALHAAVVAVLSEAVALRGTSMRDYRDAQGEKGLFKTRIKVYAREGETCPRCRTGIERIIQNQRSTFFCPRCQR